MLTAFYMGYLVERAFDLCEDDDAIGILRLDRDMERHYGAVSSDLLQDYYTGADAYAESN